jgi:hypothetical protein
LIYKQQIELFDNDPLKFFLHGAYMHGTAPAAFGALGYTPPPETEAAGRRRFLIQQFTHRRHGTAPIGSRALKKIS